MVYVMITIWVPPEKGKLFGKSVIEAVKKFGDDDSAVKTVIQAVTADEKGIKAILIGDVVKGKTSEALIQYGSLAIHHAEAIGEGFNYKLETLMSPMEAMRVIGLEMPE